MTYRKLLLFLALFVFSSTMVIAENVTLKYNAKTKDYGPVITRVIDNFLASNSKELLLKVPNGKWPIKTPVMIKYQNATKKTIHIVGATGKRPNFYFPGDVKEALPFFKFEGILMNPTNLEVHLKMLNFTGNNVPFTSSHPFYGPKVRYPSSALSFANVYTFSVQQVRIENFYGNGIFADNSYTRGYHDKLNMIQSPLINSVEIINCWSENQHYDSGAGILIGYAKNPKIINSKILNNLSHSKHYGFVAIDLETRTDGATISNNVLGGYHTLIHMECSYGGHLVKNNSFEQSKIGVNISEDCGQKVNQKSLYSPITIVNNKFSYNYEYDTYKLGDGDWGFISIYKPSFALDGLTLKNNSFKVGKSSVKPKIKGDNNKLFSDKKIYLNLQGQKNVNISGNVYE